MKTTFTLFLVLFGLTLFAQVRLDSIVTFDTDYNEPVAKGIYEYENDKISKSIEIGFGSGLLFETFYDSNGNFDYWIIDEIGDTSYVQFVYDTEQRVDSFLIKYDGVVEFGLKYSYDADLLSSVLFFEVDEGEYVPFSRKNFVYANDLLSKIEEYGIDDELNEDLEYIDTYLYNNDGNLVKNIRKETGDEDYFLDSLSYDASGNLLDYYRVLYLDGNYFMSEEIQTYTSDATVVFSDVATPLPIYEALSILLTENRTSYYPMKFGNKVDLSSSQGYYGNSETIWYYSSIVGTNERVRTIPISVYPNPSANLIRIQGDKAFAEFYLYDSNGAVVQEGQAKNNNTVDVSRLPSGSYTIIFEMKDQQHYFAQFVKQ